MKKRLSIAALMLAACAFTQGPKADDGGKGLNAQSDKQMGYVTVQSDLVLNDDRLMLTVGAFNKSAKPESLSPDAISVATAAGKPVALASLAQLEDETRAAFGGPPARSPEAYGKLSTMQRPIDVTASGEDGSNASAGDGLRSSDTAIPKKKKVDAAKLQAALDNLRAGILQGVAVEPRAAAGGQVVTQAIKFGRGEPRKLKVAVDFAGERHEFEFEVPAKAR
jgi:hypothetical protein